MCVGGEGGGKGAIGMITFFLDTSRGGKHYSSESRGSRGGFVHFLGSTNGMVGGLGECGGG